jgi:hypothetical protein
VDHIAQRLCIPARRRYASTPERQALEAERSRLLTELDDLDRQLVAVAERRQRVRDDADTIRDALWPREPWWHSRRPNAIGTTRLAPVCGNAKQLWGIHLRATCVAILERHGTQALPDLHSLLHVYGYRIGGRRPVKDLADAMAHEVNCGRAVRVSRGCYRAHQEPAEPLPAPPEHWRQAGPEVDGAARVADGGKRPREQHQDPDQESPQDQESGSARERESTGEREPKPQPPAYETEPDLVVEAIEREVNGCARHARYMRGRSTRYRGP